MEIINNRTVRPRGVDRAKVMTVIVTESLRGFGTNDDVNRRVREIWSFSGEKLAEHDPILRTAGSPCVELADD